MYECDFNVKKYAESLHCAGAHLKEISGIDFEDWDLLKLATALMIVGYPKGEQIVADNLKKVNHNILQTCCQRVAHSINGPKCVSFSFLEMTIQSL